MQVREMVSYYESLARGEAQSAEALGCCDEEENTVATTHVGQGSMVPLVAAAYPWKPISEEGMGPQGPESGEALLVDTMQDGFEERPDNEVEEGLIAALEHMGSGQSIGRLPSDIVETGQDNRMPWRSMELTASPCGKDDSNNEFSKADMAASDSARRPSGRDDDEESTASPTLLLDATPPADDGDDEMTSWEVSSDAASSPLLSNGMAAGPSSPERDGGTLERIGDPEQVPSSNDEDAVPIHNMTASQTPINSSSSIGTRAGGSSLSALIQTLPPATVYKTPMDELLFPTPSSGAVATTRTEHQIVQHFNFGQTQTSPYSPPKSLAFSPVVVKADLALREEETTWAATLGSEEEDQMGMFSSSKEGERAVHFDDGVQQSGLTPHQAIVNEETTTSSNAAANLEQRLLGLEEPSPSTPTSMSGPKIITNTGTATVNHLLRTPVGFASAVNATPRSAISSSKKEASSTPGSAFSIGALRGECTLVNQCAGKFPYQEWPHEKVNERVKNSEQNLSFVCSGCQPSSAGSGSA